MPSSLWLEKKGKGQITSMHKKQFQIETKGHAVLPRTKFGFRVLMVKEYLRVCILWGTRSLGIVCGRLPLIYRWFLMSLLEH